MKKTKYLMIAAIAVFGVAVASCDDDKDDDKGGVVARPEISDFGGERLVSAGDIRFSYNSDGTLRQVEEDGNKIIFDFSKRTLTFDGDGVVQVARFTTNTKGYITSFSTSGTEKEDDGSEYRYSLSWQFQYDAYDHLTEVVYNSVYTDLASKQQEEDNVTWKLSWSAGLLSKTDIKGSYKSNWNNDNWSTSNTYSYDNAQDNRYMQYTHGLVASIDLDNDIEAPMLVGFLGKGPTKYPTAEESVYVEEQNSDHETDNFIYEYTLNEKGLLERETEVYYATPYITEYAYSSSSKANAPSVDSRCAVDKKHRMTGRKHLGLFGRRK